jgi:hypothetical protein
MVIRHLCVCTWERTMKYYQIEPEVAGGWGKNTVFTQPPGKPWVVHKLHYEFDGWLGDELLTSAPCFIGTERLALEIQGQRLTGVRFDKAEITTSDQFRELYPDQGLPKFVWLRIEGSPRQNDFWMTSDLDLIVSERALDVLIRCGISHAAVIEFGT